WDGTPQELRILSNLADDQESEENLDDELLAWKVRKVSSCAPLNQSRDQVRPLHTRASAKKLMADALKESQVRTAKRIKLKKRMVVDEDDVQPDVVVDQEGSDETQMAASVKGKAPLSSPKPKGKRKAVPSHKKKTKKRKPTPVVSKDEMRVPADASSSSSPERASRTKKAGVSSRVRKNDSTRLSREDRQLIL
ncbi:hypothetical protein HAX54_024067, partial [Datura stramonium]|nr:hypothetical protein [Datura stramonium]